MCKAFASAGRLSVAKRFVIGLPVEDPDVQVVVHRPELDAIQVWLRGPQPSSTLWLCGPRQVGKTSGANLVRRSAAEEGWLCLEADLRNLRQSDVGDRPISLAGFVRRLVRNLLESGGLGDRSSQLDGIFEESDPIDGLRRALTALPDIVDGRQCLVVLDEFDCLHAAYGHLQPIVDAIAMCRPTSAMRFMILARSLPTLLLRDIDASKQDHMTTVELGDFPPASATLQTLASGFDDVSEGLAAAKKVMEFTEGVPGLTIRWLAAMARGERLDDIVEEVRRNAHAQPALAAPYDFLREHGAHAVRVLNQYELVRGGERWLAPSNIHFIPHLIGSGLVKIKNSNLAVRCPAYFEIYDADWAARLRDEFAASGEREKQKVVRSGPQRPKVCVLNMGGTLGMVDRGGHVMPPATTEELLQFFPGLDRVADLDVVLSEPKDGANVGPGDWARAARDIFDRRNSGCAGFVVMHGTDTMAFTASALAFAFGDKLPFPVVFTGAQARSSVLHGDAQVNLMRAIQIAVDPELPTEVLVCFQDQVLRAVTCDKQHDFRFDGFHSPSFSPIGVIGEAVRLSEKRRLRSHSLERARWTINPHFSDRVVRLGQYPGLRPEFVEAIIRGGDIDGVVFESLGVGNLPNEGHYNLMPVIQALLDQNVPVMITSRYPIVAQFASQYKPSTDPISRGAFLAGNLTHAAAITKFMWALGVCRESNVTERDRLEFIKSVIDTNLVGELDVAKTAGIQDLRKGDAS